MVLPPRMESELPHDLDSSILPLTPPPPPCTALYLSGCLQHQPQPSLAFPDVLCPPEPQESAVRSGEHRARFYPHSTLSSLCDLEQVTLSETPLFVPRHRSNAAGSPQLVYGKHSAQCPPSLS